MRYVQFTRGRYAVRVTVPPELRDVIGKRELVEPLGGDKKHAERKAHGVVAGFLAQIEDARERLAANRPTLSTAAKNHFKAELEADDRARWIDGPAATASLNAWSAPRRATLLRLVASGEIVGDEAEALVGYAAHALAAKGLAPDVPRSELLRTLAGIQLEAMAVVDARDRSAVTLPAPQSPLLTQPDPEPVTAPPDRGSGSTLSDVLKAFHSERTAGTRTLAEKTMEEHKSAVRMFEDFMGGTVAARSITRKDMLAYKQALLRTPTRYTLRFRCLTLPQAIKANEKRKEPYETLDPATINVKWLSHLSSIFKWAMNNGYTDD